MASGMATLGMPERGSTPDAVLALTRRFLAELHPGVAWIRPVTLDSALEKDLFEIYARGERRRVVDMRALLGPLGIPLTLAHASDPPAMLLWKARGRRGAVRPAIPA